MNGQKEMKADLLISLGPDEGGEQLTSTPAPMATYLHLGIIMIE